LHEKLALQYSLLNASIHTINTIHSRS